MVQPLTNEIRERYGRLLRSRGLRASDNRMRLLWLLDQPNVKYTVPELCAKVREYDPGQGHAPVYASLREMLQAGLLRTLVVLGKGHFDGWQIPHHNLICRSCGAVESRELGEIDTTPLVSSAKQLGYHLGQPGLDIEGICPRCLGH